MIREYRFPAAREGDLRRRRAAAGGGSRLDRWGCRRALVLTGNSLAARTALVRKLEHVLGGRRAGTCSGIRQHVPSRTVAAAVAQAREVRADALVAFGGGSPIDAAKLVALELAAGRGAAGGHAADRGFDHAVGRRVHAVCRYHRRADAREGAAGGSTDLSAHGDSRSAGHPGHAAQAVGRDRREGDGPCHRSALVRQSPAGQRCAGHGGHPQAAALPARIRRPAGRPRGARRMPGRGLDVDLRHGQRGRAPEPRAGSPDRRALGCSARRDLLHHAAALHALPRAADVARSRG